MSWLRSYCKHFNLSISGTTLFDKNNNAIGKIDMYNDIVEFDHDKFTFGDFALALVNDCDIHNK